MMPLLRVASETLKIDKQQAYMLANKGMADLVEYKQRDDAHRKAVLDELTAEAEKHGLGY
ncbi:MAG: hypothetical protein IT376_09855 [Polyangiaceae bacterium]|nr:hypothetical protein [Polyangiaceae bacterium]